MMIRVHNRQSNRLSGYDYTSSGAYFVTICSYQRQHLFGEINNGNIKLSQIGNILIEEWFKTALIRPEIILDEYVIMPNHFHGIVWIGNNVGAHGNAPPHCDAPRPGDSAQGSNPSEAPGAHYHAPLRRPRSLSTWVAGFKSVTTHRAREAKLEYAIWQRNYYDRIIRNENELHAIRTYIKNNPANWQLDEFKST